MIPFKILIVDKDNYLVISDNGSGLQRLHRLLCDKKIECRFVAESFTDREGKAYFMDAIAVEGYWEDGFNVMKNG